MSCCDHDCCEPAQTDNRYRRILWAALVVNLTMFGVELVASIIDRSVSLRADALDFLADAQTIPLPLPWLAWRYSGAPGRLRLRVASWACSAYGLPPARFITRSPARCHMRRSWAESGFWRSQPIWPLPVFSTATARATAKRCRCGCAPATIASPISP